MGLGRCRAELYYVLFCETNFEPVYRATFPNHCHGETRHNTKEPNHTNDPKMASCLRVHSYKPLSLYVFSDKNRLALDGRSLREGQEA